LGFPTAPNESENARGPELLASRAIPARRFGQAVHRSRKLTSLDQPELAPRAGRDR